MPVSRVPSRKGGDLSEARLKSGWEEFDGKPGRLVAEYAVRLVGVLASMSKARSYILGQVGINQTYSTTVFTNKKNTPDAEKKSKPLLCYFTSHPSYYLRTFFLLFPP